MSSNRSPRHILEQTQEEKKNFLDSFDIVFSDCDGVIWLVLGAIPKSGDAMSLLNKAGKKCRFISNNSMRTDEEYLSKFNEIGISFTETDDIVHPVKTILKYLKKHKANQKIFTIASDEFNDALRKAEIDLVELENENKWSASKFVEIIRSKSPVGAVIIDIDYNLNVAKLNQAKEYLKDVNCDLIVGATDMLIPMLKDFTVLGTAGFIKILSDVSGKEPIILGKPGPLLGKFLIENFGITEPKRTLFIGDALLQDIKFGRSCGFQTLLVLSGATTREQLNHCDDELKPDFYADSLADLLELLKENM